MKKVIFITVAVVLITWGALFLAVNSIVNAVTSEIKTRGLENIIHEVWKGTNK